MSTDNATKTDLLSLKDRLNKLDAMADDPWGHDPVEWDGAYADAQYEARACKGMAMGAKAHDIAERFKRAGKRFHACAALDLVPAEKAVSFSMDVRVANADPISPDNTGAPPAKDFELWTGEDLYQHHAKNNGWVETWSQLGWADKAAWHRAAAEMHNAAHGRGAGMAPKADPIGPGDPLPPPPPPTLTAEDIQLAWDECQATKCVMLGYKMAVQLAEACNDVLLMKARNKSNKLHELA